MNDKRVYTDERTETVVNYSYKISYLTLYYLLSLDIIIRAFLELKNIKTWFMGIDILIILMITNGLATLIQARKKVIPKRIPMVRFKWMLFTMALIFITVLIIYLITV